MIPVTPFRAAGTVASVEAFEIIECGQRQLRWFARLRDSWNGTN